MKEKCWGIIEKRPIKVKINKTSGGYIISVPEMSMTYNTFMMLGDNLLLDKKTFEYSMKVCEADNHTFRHSLNHMNDVLNFQYDFTNGVGVFLSSSVENIKVWGKKFCDIVEINFGEIRK